MIDLGKIKQGERGTLTITWEFPDSLTAPASISGATITATMLDLDTGDVTAVSGTLTATGATTATWALSSGDSGTAGTFHVTFRADVSGTPIYTLNAALEVEENPAATAVQNDALVGVTSAEAAWVTAGEAGGDLGTAAYVDTIDEDDMVSDSDTAVPTQQSVKAYVDANAGGGDVGDLTTDGLTAANMLRVAAAGGLEERTPAQVLSDIGAEASGAAATVQGNLDTHTGNTSNPHSVTAAQVSALPLAGGTLTGNLIMSTGQEVRATDNQPLIISARGNANSYTKVTAQSGSAAVLDIIGDTGVTELRINGKKAFGNGVASTSLGLGQGFASVAVYSEFQVIPLTGSGTVATNNMLYLGVQTNDTPVAGFGGSIKMVLESSTTANRDAARIAVLWNNATHASRAADLVHYVTDYGAEREVLRLRATGTAAAISLFGSTPQAQSTGWAVTNVTPDKVFDADSTSLDELADVLGTLITYLIARGDLAA